MSGTFCNKNHRLLVKSAENPNHFHSPTSRFHDDQYLFEYVYFLCVNLFFYEYENPKLKTRSLTSKQFELISVSFHKYYKFLGEG